MTTKRKTSEVIDNISKGLLIGALVGLTVYMLVGMGRTLGKLECQIASEIRSTPRDYNPTP